MRAVRFAKSKGTSHENIVALVKQYNEIKLTKIAL